MGILEAIVMAFGCMMSLILLVQDVRSRAISIVPAIILCGLGGIFRYLRDDETWWQQVLANGLMISFILGLMVLVMRILRPGRRVLNEQFGSGDLLYFFMMIGWWDPLGFMLWLVSGLIALVITMGILLATRAVGKEYPIPLAGILAGYSILFFPAYWLAEDGVWAVAGRLMW